MNSADDLIKAFRTYYKDIARELAMNFAQIATAGLEDYEIQAIEDRIRAGWEEHDGSIAEMSFEEIFGEAREEAMDVMIYPCALLALFSGDRKALAEAAQKMQELHKFGNEPTHEGVL